MIFGTRMSYIISWQFLENKVRSPVSKKEGWALFSVVIFGIIWESGLFLPRNFPVVLIIFAGRGTQAPPPLPVGRGVHPCLEGSAIFCLTIVQNISLWLLVCLSHKSDLLKVTLLAILAKLCDDETNDKIHTADGISLLLFKCSKSWCVLAMWQIILISFFGGEGGRGSASPLLTPRRCL